MKKRFFAAALALGPAVLLSGCGAGGALNKLTNPTFHDVPIPLTTNGLISVSGNLANLPAPTNAGGLNTNSSTFQTMVNDLSAGNLSSLTPSIKLSVTKNAGSRSVGGTHVGIVLSTNPTLTTAAFWAAASPAASRAAVVTTVGGSVTVVNPGSYSFGPTNPGDGTYAGNLMDPGSIDPSKFNVVGFDTQNPAALASDFQSLVNTAAATQSGGVFAYIGSFNDDGSAGTVQVNGLAVGGTLHVNL